MIELALSKNHQIVVISIRDSKILKSNVWKLEIFILL